MEENKYSYDRFGSKGVRVGQAVTDILSKEQPNYTVEEILEEMGKGVMKYIMEAAEEGSKKYKTTFYILHLLKKELGALGVSNAVLQKASCFPDRKWKPEEVMEAHPHSAKTLYEVDPKHGTLTLAWTVPGWEDCRSIMKNPGLYDQDLVKWVKQAVDALSDSVA